ncbi:hypothetical protein ABZ468_35310 [Streptomyces sp. NPDC005708]|uniref:hypothetical protein n=1 Tax=Streptomyces sp. NPDC005708 TaxID=3154564 RepID=UPI0033C7DE15
MTASTASSTTAAAGQTATASRAAWMTARRLLITTGQTVVRAAEQYGSRETVTAVHAALRTLPVIDLDEQAHSILLGALEATAKAVRATEWTLLVDVEQTVSPLVNPGGHVFSDHPAVIAMTRLINACTTRQAAYTVPGCPNGTITAAAWQRAAQAGIYARGKLNAVLNGVLFPRQMDDAMADFRTAVRRAIPYEALYETRRALVEAARCYQLFVVGMRQPMPADSLGEWARRLGEAVYLFEVLPPQLGQPHGSVAVQRIRQDGTADPVRHIPLGGDLERRRAVHEIRRRI